MPLGSSWRDFDGISGHGRGLAARGRRLGECGSRLLDHLLLHPALGKRDRVPDRMPGRATVTDHDQPAQAEQISAADRLWIETLAQPPELGPEQDATERRERARAGGVAD